MDLTPQGNYVLCEAEPLKLPHGIILAGDNVDSRKPPSYARMKVIKVGPGKLLDDGTRARPQVSEGDYVVVHQLAFQNRRVQMQQPALYDGRELLLVDAGDIIATESGEVRPAAPKLVTARPKLEPVH